MSNEPKHTEPKATFDCPEWPMCKETGKCADGVVSHNCPALKGKSK